LSTVASVPLLLLLLLIPNKLPVCYCFVDVIVVAVVVVLLIAQNQTLFNTCFLLCCYRDRREALEYIKRQIMINLRGMKPIPPPIPVTKTGPIPSYPSDTFTEKTQSFYPTCKLNLSVQFVI